MELFIIIGWLVLCFAAAAYTSSKGRSGVEIFFLSLFLSPLVGFIVALVMEPNQQNIATAKGMKKCPECAQFVQPDARTCPFCKTSLAAQIAPPTAEFNPNALSPATPPAFCSRCGWKIRNSRGICVQCAVSDD
jgi:uncharacterized paraquat-inducible protein A